ARGPDAPARRERDRRGARDGQGPDANPALDEALPHRSRGVPALTSSGARRRRLHLLHPTARCCTRQNLAPRPGFTPLVRSASRVLLVAVLQRYPPDRTFGFQFCRALDAAARSWRERRSPSRMLANRCAQAARRDSMVRALLMVPGTARPGR